MQTLAELSRAVARLLETECSAKTRSEVMDLCAQLLEHADARRLAHDDLTAETICGWISRLQHQHGLQ